MDVKPFFLLIDIELEVEAFFELYIYGYMNYITLETGSLGENLGCFLTFFSASLIIFIMLFKSCIWIFRSPEQLK